MKKITALLLALVLTLSMTLALAQAVPASSVTIDSITSTTGTVVTEGDSSGLIVYLAPIEMSTQEQAVLDKLTTHVQSQPVAEYFAPEVIEAAASYLPAGTDTASLQMDEFLVLKTEGYTPEVGDAKVAFEFVTPYKAEDKLVGMVGILPSETKDIASTLKAAGLEGMGSYDEDGIFWLAVKVEVVDGKVIVYLPQGALELTLDCETVFALFSAR